MRKVLDSASLHWRSCMSCIHLLVSSFFFWGASGPFGCEGLAVRVFAAFFVCSTGYGYLICCSTLIEGYLCCPAFTSSCLFLTGFLLLLLLSLSNIDVVSCSSLVCFFYPSTRRVPPPGPLCMWGTWSELEAIENQTPVRDAHIPYPISHIRIRGARSISRWGTSFFFRLSFVFRGTMGWEWWDGGGRNFFVLLYPPYVSLCTESLFLIELVNLGTWHYVLMLFVFPFLGSSHVWHFPFRSPHPSTRTIYTLSQRPRHTPFFFSFSVSDSWHLRCMYVCGTSSVHLWCCNAEKASLHYLTSPRCARATDRFFSLLPYFPSFLS